MRLRPLSLWPLSAIKRQAPDESAINIAAEATILWRTVRVVIDVVRHQLLKASYDDEAAWTAALGRFDPEKAEDLFPQVVFVVAE